MPNFFDDNRDLVAHFAALDLREVVSVLEDDFELAKSHDDAPECYDDAIDLYRTALQIIGKMAAEFIEPRSAAVDAEGATFEDGCVNLASGTKEAIRELSKAGFMGVIIPREFGGANFPATIYMMMIEIISRADAALMTLFGYQDVGESIARFGTPDQAERFLSEYVVGGELGAMVLSEPDAGSDLKEVRLRAYQNDSGDWFLHGTKHFISNGCGEILLVLARTGNSPGSAFGLSLFVCRSGENVVVSRIEDKMGLHGSPTCELFFENAPAELIGRQGMGLLRYVLQILNHARFSVAAQGLGIAEAAYESALAYSRQRKQFGKLIGDMPQIAGMLADMRTCIVSARALLYAGAYWLDERNRLEENVERRKKRGEDATELQIRLSKLSPIVDLLSPLTKYWVTETANTICYDAQQVHGGLGYMKESKVERFVRDVRITTIYEGTSQVQIAASIQGVCDDVLKPEFERLPIDDVAPELSSAAENLSRARELFDQCREFLDSEGGEEIRESSAKDLTDVYVGLYIGHLLLNRPADVASLAEIASRHCAHTHVRAAGALTGLKANRWQSVSDARKICSIEEMEGN